MNLKLQSNESLRINTGHAGNNFIDVCAEKDQIALTVQALASMQYMEIRKKGGIIKTFYFENKHAKKSFDFGWWEEDAEVIFANNEVKHNK